MLLIHLPGSSSSSWTEAWPRHVTTSFPQELSRAPHDLNNYQVPLFCMVTESALCPIASSEVSTLPSAHMGLIAVFLGTLPQAYHPSPNCPTLHSLPLKNLYSPMKAKPKHHFLRKPFLLPSAYSTRAALFHQFLVRISTRLLTPWGQELCLTHLGIHMGPRTVLDIY